MHFCINGVNIIINVNVTICLYKFILFELFFIYSSLMSIINTGPTIYPKNYFTNATFLVRAPPNIRRPISL